MPPFLPPVDSAGQRRFDRIFVGVTLLAVAALIAGLVVYTHVRHGQQARVQARAAAAAKAKAVAAAIDAVRQAYLAYWSALSRAYQDMNVAPLAAETTPAGAQQEEKTIQSFKQTGYLYRLTAEHDMQVVVYSGGDLASVDDNLLQHVTPLDPSTLQPVGPAKTLPIHSSYELQERDGRWLVDSLVSFGANGSDPASGLSYAALNRNNPLPSNLKSEIEQAYLAYWAARKEAYRKLDPSPLLTVVEGQPLEGDESTLTQDTQKKQGFDVQVEHNIRIALKEADTAYVYDTVADSSFNFDLVTKQRSSPAVTSILREAAELKKHDGHWIVDLGVLHH